MEASGGANDQVRLRFPEGHSFDSEQQCKAVLPTLEARDGTCLGLFDSAWNAAQEGPPTRPNEAEAYDKMMRLAASGAAVYLQGDNGCEEWNFQADPDRPTSGGLKSKRVADSKVEATTYGYRFGWGAMLLLSGPNYATYVNGQREPYGSAAACSTLYWIEEMASDRVVLQDWDGSSVSWYLSRRSCFAAGPLVAQQPGCR